MSTAAHGEFVIGNYRIGQTIGQGTFGKVRLGIHIPTDMKVAVKTLQKQKIVQQADIQRVTREICILKILRHPNIVQLYEIIETKTDIHLIMEYASGGELFDYIVRKKRLDEQEAIGFMQQLLSGVDYIHKIGIVHRDLKPQNLLFDENKRIKIVDFGLSNQYKPGQKLKTACGSPCYAAPEMIAGKRYECLNIDIWSCGIILYAMLCGYLPFEDPNTNKLYKKIMMGQYEQPKVLTPDSKQMLKNILNVNPESRFKIQQIKQSKWYNLVDKKYEAKGIIVGNDPIVADEAVVATMKRMGVTADPAQIRNYIANNRHNNITAYYYLLMKKALKNPKILSPQKESRSSSPLFYKPEVKKDYFMPFKKPATTNSNHTKDTSKVNDSFNASKIVSSLVEANKAKIAGGGQPKKKDVYEEFKLFPKHKNSSQYEPSSAHTTHTPVGSINLNSTFHNRPQASTSRSDAEDKQRFSFPTKIDKEPLSFKSKPETTTASKTLQEAETASPAPADTPLDNKETEHTKREEQPAKNKRREELSDQLKQISLKIDKEITELRKHNNLSSSMMSNEKRRQSFGTSLTQKLKVPQTTGQAGEHKSVIQGHSKTQMEVSNGNKLTQYKEMPTKFPKMHFGPFNAQCLVMEAPRTILLRIVEHLNAQKVSFKQVDLFTVRLASNELISVESIHGISGYHIVKFSNSSTVSEGLLQHLAAC